MNGMKLYMALAVWMFAAPAWATCGVGGYWGSECGPQTPDPAGDITNTATARAEAAEAKVKNLHAVEEKHRQTANEQFHRANRLQAENERLREGIVNCLAAGLPYEVAVSARAALASDGRA